MPARIDGGTEVETQFPSAQAQEISHEEMACRSLPVALKAKLI